jgi:hypothetical protein
MSSSGDGAINAAGIAVRAVRRAAFLEALDRGVQRADAAIAADRVADEERAEQCRLMRDILGNPFSPIPPKKGRRAWEEQRRVWLGKNEQAAAKLAEVVYRERRFEDLPILADALEEAGCDVTGILVHLRDPGPHVLGCWGLDLLLSEPEG